MAQKKKAALKQRFAVKKKPQKPSTPTAPSPPSEPSKPQYSDVFFARGEWQHALEQVKSAERGLNRVRADHSDFEARDLRVTDAEEVLARTRVFASAAKREFTQVKAAAR